MSILSLSVKHFSSFTKTRYYTRLETRGPTEVMKIQRCRDSLDVINTEKPIT